MPDLMDMFDDLDKQIEPAKKDIIVKAPFGYPGGKSRSIEHILPNLPYRNCYVEPFGGSGAVLLARQRSSLEVLNDRYMGITAFYQCLRNKAMMEKVCEWLALTVHSREEFVECKDTWANVDDPIERAARWYYMIAYSFGSKGNNWGRSVSGRGHLAGKILNRIKEFPAIYERIKKVQIENQDWKDCLRDYDSFDTVFYLDPPYIDAYAGTYKFEMTQDEHKDLIDAIFATEGFVAVSGFSNPLYENRPWDDRIEWEVFSSIKGMAFTEGNKRSHLEGRDTERSFSKEVLWIKEAR